LNFSMLVIMSVVPVFGIFVYMFCTSNESIPVSSLNSGF
jgi:hypothetical protein